MNIPQLSFLSRGLPKKNELSNMKHGPVALAILKTKKKTAQTPDQERRQEMFKPALPNQPITYEQSLGYICLDKQVPYTVHAQVVDRNTIYDMFVPQTKFYALNAMQLWFWGDGTSSRGGAFSHTYPKEGKYEVSVFIDVAFRGGAIVRITCTGSIEIPAAQGHPIVAISPVPLISGTTNDTPQSIPIAFSNSGGREAYITPFCQDQNGAEPSWVSFVPKNAFVLNDGNPVNFSLNINWPDAPVEESSLDIKYSVDLFTKAWTIKYANAQIL
jgi:hypothetical protein